MWYRHFTGWSLSGEQIYGVHIYGVHIYISYHMRICGFANDIFVKSVIQNWFYVAQNNNKNQWKKKIQFQSNYALFAGFIRVFILQFSNFKNVLTITFVGLSFTD